MKTESASVQIDLETCLQTTLLSHPRSQKGIFWLLLGTPSHCYSPQQSGREAETRCFQGTGLTFLLGSGWLPRSWMQSRAEGCSWAPVNVRTKCRHDAILQRQSRGRTRVGMGVETRAWGSWGARPTRVLEAVSIGRGWACEGGNVDPGWPAYSLAKHECRTGEWEGAGVSLRCPRRGLLRSVVSGVEASHGAAFSRGQFPTYQSLVGTNAGQPSARPRAGSGDAGVTEQRLGSGEGAAQRGRRRRRTYICSAM